jgi:thrombospondin motif-containing protein 19
MAILIYFYCYIFQMGFIQLNEDFIFIEPLNDTMAITGHPHRLYRQKRSMEERATEKSALGNPYCGVISGNAFF